MVKVCHIVNSFDPACDVLRCVRELNRYSQHSHSLYVKEPHPDQHVYHYDQPKKPGWLMLSSEIKAMIDGADVLIHHFTGADAGYGSKSRPSAYRNLHITYDKDSNRFWTSGIYDAPSYDDYKLVAASHVGALDFMPASKFRWLPDLVPLDGDYLWDDGDRPQTAISYIKHADELRQHDFHGISHLDCSRTTHSDVIAVRRSLASVVIDNVSDGHYGLAGQEAAILGLPVIGFNHQITLTNMCDWEKPGTISPFIEAATVTDAASAAVLAAQKSGRMYRSYRLAIRKWAEEFLDPRRLIGDHWDPFIKELAS
jgi:hypothetical protein